MEPIKKLTGIATALSLSALIAIPTFAGTWKQLEGGKYWQWQYVEDDGSYPTNNWKLINEKWYHFDNDGYLDVGFQNFDNNYYVLMRSGALETNRDYGFASSDSNGVWTVKPLDYETLNNNNIETSMYEDYCKQYGIDIDKVFSELWQSEYTYSCSTEKFPQDIEGNIIVGIAAKCMSEAINARSTLLAIDTSPYTWSWKVENGIFSITYKSSLNFGGIYNY
ncbi:MAG: hypothetical protein E7251_10275 [Paenibacillaceae bacterium]|nr:hypothetical protein [Paenibacillaceae bacterium]